MIHRFSSSASVITLTGAVFAFLLVGCGGGGGSSRVSPFGKSYHFAAAGQLFDVTIDSVGRLTVYVEDAQLPAGAGAQGAASPAGQFSAHSDDGTLQIAGTVSSDGTAATGSVTLNNALVFNFTATLVPPVAGANTSSLSGTFKGANGATPVFLTIDGGGHGTLATAINGVGGVGLINVSNAGAITTPAGNTSGSFSVAGNPTLILTQWKGAAVNITVVFTRISKAKWTFMVYLNAANNLQEFGPLNVNQMEQVGSTSDVNIVVQWKQANCAGCGSPDWLGTRRYFVTKDNNTNNVSSTLLQDMGTGVDMGDWRTLRTFTQWAEDQYPADHYALVVWNHGAGWLPTKAAGNRMPVFPRSVSIDDSTNHEIQIWELPQALQVTTQGDRHPLDMLIFDASLMQMAEVAYEVKDVIAGPSAPGVMVGSEESPPGEGYVYNTFLAALTSNPSMSAAQFGTEIVNDTLNDYGVDTNLTQSALDLSKMQGVADSLSSFAGSLSAHIVDSGAAEKNARNTVEHYIYTENKDLYDYAEIIKNTVNPADLKAAANGMQNAITSALIAQRHGNLHPNSHGLAIYIPDPLNYRSSYANLALARNTTWDEWLQNQPQ